MYVCHSNLLPFPETNAFFQFTDLETPVTYQPECIDKNSKTLKF